MEKWRREGGVLRGGHVVQGVESGEDGGKETEGKLCSVERQRST